MNTTKLKISVKDKSSSRASSEENEILIETNLDQVSLFSGIDSATVVPGQSDTMVDISWTNPNFIGSIVPETIDPVFYEVSYTTKNNEEVLINDDSLVGVNLLRVPSAPTFISVVSAPSGHRLTNLTPNTEYVFRVRAIHKTWFDNYVGNGGSGSLPLNEVVTTDSREMNTKTFTVKTDPFLGPASFDATSIQAVAPPNVDGYDKVDVSWSQASGKFYGYKIFYRKFDGTPGDEDLDDRLTDSVFADFDDNAFSCTANYIVDHGCLNVDSRETLMRVQGLDQLEHYQFKVAVCRSLACPVKQTEPDAALISEMRSAKTTAVLSPFSGITSINNPQSGADLNPTR